MNQFAKKYLKAATVLFVVAAISWYEIRSCDCCYLKAWLIPFTAILLSLTGTLIFLSFTSISRLHTPKSAFAHFLYIVVIYVLGYLYYRKFVKLTRNVRSTQDRKLKEILKFNAGTELGQKLGYRSIENREQFRAKIPLSSFKDYQDYIDRIEKGEENVYTAGEVIKFSISSGTTGKCKHIPFIKSMTDIFTKEVYFPLSYHIQTKRGFMRRFSPLKGADFSFMPNWKFTERGIPIGPFQLQYDLPSAFFLAHTTPREGLQDDQLPRITALFAGTLLVYFEFLQDNWKQLADDIRHGRITNTHNIPLKVVADILRMPTFRANPKRADEIEAACLKGFQGVAKRIWPRLTEIMTITSGSHRLFLDRCKWFTGSSVSMVAFSYGASEGAFGISLTATQRQSEQYTLLVGSGFFEFIPEDEVLIEHPRTLFADQLQVGKRYELVLTHENGMCRYRIGDIIKVRNFFNEAPVIEFCTRVGDIINLRAEKTTEEMMASAVNSAVSKMKGKCELVNYTVTESVTLEKSLKPESNNFDLFYVIFVELDGLSRSLTDEEIDLFDKELCLANPFYKVKRDISAILKPKIFAVRQGTFEELKKRILERNDAVSNQFKPPQYQKHPDSLKFLVDSSFIYSL